MEEEKIYELNKHKKWRFYDIVEKSKSRKSLFDNLIWTYRYDNLEKDKEEITTMRKALEYLWLFAWNETFFAEFYKKKFWSLNASWRSSMHDRRIELYTDRKFVKYHEYWHHISEFNKKTMWWYSSYKNSKQQLRNTVFNEWFTELWAYLCCKNEQWWKYKINHWAKYDEYVNFILKIIDLINIKNPELSKEYIYKDMMKWYFIKWYKWLNLIYKTFGKDIIKEITNLYDRDVIYDKQKRWFNYTNIDKLIDIYYNKFWFNSIQESRKYFNYKNKPSNELLEISWIQR